MIQEREGRANSERAAANFAHYTRLMSDSFYFCISIGIQVTKFAGKDSSFFYALSKSKDELGEIAKKYMSKLQEDKDYDKFRVKTN